MSDDERADFLNFEATRKAFACSPSWNTTSSTVARG
jgi:hypothetical protein